MSISLYHTFFCPSNLGRRQLYIETEKSDSDSDIMAMVKTYVDEMTIKYITGKESFDNYDTFLAQLDEFGIKEAMENRQNAYKKYLNR